MKVWTSYIADQHASLTGSSFKQNRYKANNVETDAVYLT
jgi:hypothetical protein